MFFKFGIEVFGKVEFLVMEYIKSGVEVIYFDGIIGCDLKLIIRFGECDGFVRCECFLIGVKIY